MGTNGRGFFAYNVFLAVLGYLNHETPSFGAG